MCSARNSKDTAQNPQAPWPLVEDPSLERDNRPRRAKGTQQDTSNPCIIAPTGFSDFDKAKGKRHSQKKLREFSSNALQ
uniref:Uncharacterized protein n=1 Tax=Knipowitschia caucasica TaxID=637954 RepID=A0AAV2KW83_KNICA